MTSIQRFELPLAAGVGWLDLPCAAPGEGLAQARALATALPVLAAAESWLATELPCPEPVQWSPADRGRAGGLCLPFDVGSGLMGGQLVLPWAALKPGRQPPAGLAVQWPQWPSQICLQTLPLPRLAAGALVPGAVLLLPAAFSGAWAVQVQASGRVPGAFPAGWQVASRWQPHEARLALPGGPVRASPERGDWSVWLAAPLSVDLRAWFGGCTQVVPVPAGLAELRRGSRSVASGRLLPCGAGWGLQFEQVESLELGAAWT